MSGAKKVGKVLVSVPMKIVSLPATVAVSKTLRGNQQHIKDAISARDEVICTFCSVKPFKLCQEPKILEGEVRKEAWTKADNRFFWQCSECTFFVETETNDLQELKNYIAINGHEIYASSIAHQDVVNQRSNGDIEIKVAEHVRYAIAMCMINIIVLPISLYGFYIGSWIFALSAFMLGVTVAFMGATCSYRGWQLFTNSFYSKEPQLQFKWFLLNRNWLLMPGNPLYLDNLYFDDGYSDDNFNRFENTAVENTEKEAVSSTVSEVNTPINYFSTLTFYYVEPYHYYEKDDDDNNNKVTD